jgi:hypothetical protein
MSMHTVRVCMDMRMAIEKKLAQLKAISLPEQATLSCFPLNSWRVIA